MDDDFPILAVIAAHPAHPYAVMEHLATLGFSAPRRTLYRRVDALITGRMLKERVVRGDSGHRRRQLALTAGGTKALAHHALDALTSEPLDSSRFALALGCAEVGGEAAVAAILRERMAESARELTREERAAGEASAGWSRSIAERRVAHLKADIGWLQVTVGKRAAAG